MWPSEPTRAGAPVALPSITAAKIAHPGGVAARPIEAGDETKLDRVAAASENDGNSCGRCFGRECRPARRRWQR